MTYLVLFLCLLLVLAIVFLIGTPSARAYFDDMFQQVPQEPAHHGFLSFSSVEKVTASLRHRLPTSGPDGRVDVDWYQSASNGPVILRLKFFGFPFTIYPLEIGAFDSVEKRFERYYAGFNLEDDQGFLGWLRDLAEIQKEPWYNLLSHDTDLVCRLEPQMDGSVLWVLRSMNEAQEIMRTASKAEFVHALNSYQFYASQFKEKLGGIPKKHRAPVTKNYKFNYFGYEVSDPDLAKISPSVHVELSPGTDLDQVIQDFEDYCDAVASHLLENGLAYIELNNSFLVVSEAVVSNGPGTSILRFRRNGDTLQVKDINSLRFISGDRNVIKGL